MESRITDLEVKVSFNEDLLEELNRTVFQQQQQIDALKNELRMLRQQMQTSFPAEARNLQDDIPPHY
ncbi:MAG: SlyX family protein [Betaproteobacteria bacterium]